MRSRWSGELPTRLLEAHGTMPNIADLASAPKIANLTTLRPSQRMNAAIWIARAAARAGAHELSRQFLASLTSDQLARMPARYGDLGALGLLAETYVDLGDAEGAATLYQQLAPHAALNAVGPAFDYDGSVEHYLGILASQLGRKSQAEQHFERAERFNERLRMPLALARTRARREALAAE